MAQQHIESPIFVLVKFCSDQEITIAKSSDIVSAEMSSTSTKKINKVLATWKAQGTEIKVKWPTKAAMRRNTQYYAEKDYRIFAANVMDFSSNYTELMDKEKTLYTAKKSIPANSISPQNKSSNQKSNTRPSKKLKQDDDEALGELLHTSSSESEDSDEDGEELSEDDSEKKRKKKEQENKEKQKTPAPRPDTPDMFADDSYDEDRREYTPLKPVETITTPAISPSGDSSPTTQQDISMEEYTQILASKDQQIESLKAENQVLKDRLENHPGIIVDELKSILETAKSLASGGYHMPMTPGSSSSSPSPTPSSGRRSADCFKPVKKVPLFKGSHIYLDPVHLKLAVSYGISDKSEKAKKAVVYRIMESIYTEEFMASHSSTGRAKPGDSKEKAKPSLPNEDIDAIFAFVKSCWKEWHKLDIEEGSIKGAIQDKLQSAHRKKKNVQNKIASLKESFSSEKPN